MVTKDDAGKIHVNKDEMATRHGAWGGAAVGAVVGILFPPAIIGSALVGAAVGGVGGHLWRGMSRADVKEFGDVMDTGQAALLIVGESKLQQAMEKATLKAERHVTKELDVSTKDVDQAVQEAAKEVADLPVDGGPPRWRRTAVAGHWGRAPGPGRRQAGQRATSAWPRSRWPSAVPYGPWAAWQALPNTARFNGRNKRF